MEVEGINVNGRAPVFTLAAINNETFENPVKRDWVLGRIPMKRVGQLTFSVESFPSLLKPPTLSTAKSLSRKENGWQRKKSLTSISKCDIGLTKISIYSYHVAKSKGGELLRMSRPE